VCVQAAWQNLESAFARMPGKGCRPAHNLDGAIVPKLSSQAAAERCQRQAAHTRTSEHGCMAIAASPSSMAERFRQAYVERAARLHDEAARAERAARRRFVRASAARLAVDCWLDEL
jgi:hypothetical protein